MQNPENKKVDKKGVEEPEGLVNESDAETIKMNNFLIE